MDIGLLLGYVKAFMEMFGIYDIFLAAMSIILILTVVTSVIKSLRS